MADYYPLISRAVEGLSQNTAGLRQAVYERARGALLHQLRSLDPPLAETDIARERLSLDEAIDRVERDYGALEPAVAPAREPVAAAALPLVDENIWPEAEVPAAAAPVPVLAPRPPPRRLRGSSGPDQAPSGASTLPELPRERPRIDTIGPVIARPGRGRSAILASVLVVVMGGIAVTAWLLRDQPPELPARESAAEPVRPAEGESKFAERVTSEPRPSAPTPGPTQPAAPQPPATTGTSTPRPEVSIAQRAILYEENPADPQTPRATGARALWRLDALNTGQGQPLETVVRGTIETEGGINLNLLLRRNLDAALPASHTIELAFSTNPNDPNRVVRDVGKLALKNEEGLPGTPLAGLQVPVTTNLFLFGLSNVPRDIDRNTELLLKRNWIDLPIMFASGQRAVLSFEKGLPGETVLEQAFKQW